MRGECRRSSRYRSKLASRTNTALAHPSARVFLPVQADGGTSHLGHSRRRSLCQERPVEVDTDHAHVQLQCKGTELETRGHMLAARPGVDRDGCHAELGPQFKLRPALLLT
jgi:murein endopeptidase